MNKLSAQLNGNGRKRIVHGKDSSSDSVARFQAKHLARGAFQYPQGGQSRGSGPHDSDIDVHGGIVI